MFELPEFVTLASQMNNVIQGKTILKGGLGNSPHKFVWYNKTDEEFNELTKDKIIGEASARGKWLFVPLEPGYVLLLGECGGKVLYHPMGSLMPKKYHLDITFDDGSFLTATTQMWGAMELYKKGEEQNRQYIKDMKPAPLDKEFSYDYFSVLIDELKVGKKRSVKALLTQDQIIPGLGNAIIQDILFNSRLHPKHLIADLNASQVKDLYDSIVKTVKAVIEKGGRNDEFDLFNNKGGYVRIMDKNAVKHPCPECAGDVIKIQYLGGSCYLCQNCQK